METSSQPPQLQRTQTEEELDLEIIDLPDIREASSTRHAWLWHIVLHVQRAVNPRSRRLIQTCFTLLLALIAMLLLLSSILHPLASSPVFTPDQQELFASSNPIHYDRNPLTVYRGHRGPVRSVAWSPNGELLAACGQDATVQIWVRQTGKLLSVYRGHSKTVTGIAWSPDSTRIASVSLDGTSQVWDARTGKLLFIYHNHNPVSSIYSVAWSPGGFFIATGGADGLVKLWFIARPAAGEHAVHESLFGIRS